MLSFYYVDSKKPIKFDPFFTSFIRFFLYYFDTLHPKFPWIVQNCTIRKYLLKYFQSLGTLWTNLKDTFRNNRSFNLIILYPKDASYASLGLHENRSNLKWSPSMTLLWKLLWGQVSDLFVTNTGKLSLTKLYITNKICRFRFFSNTLPCICRSI